MHRTNIARQERGKERRKTVLRTERKPDWNREEQARLRRVAPRRVSKPTHGIERSIGLDVAGRANLQLIHAPGEAHALRRAHVQTTGDRELQLRRRQSELVRLGQESTSLSWNGEVEDQGDGPWSEWEEADSTRQLNDRSNNQVCV